LGTLRKNSSSQVWKALAIPKIGNRRMAQFKNGELNVRFIWR
jgi:hypothetical protein